MDRFLNPLSSNYEIVYPNIVGVRTSKSPKQLVAKCIQTVPGMLMKLLLESVLESQHGLRVVRAPRRRPGRTVTI